MLELSFPKKFIETVLTIWPSDGQIWLDSLPDLVQFYGREWELEPQGILPNLSMNCLLSVRCKNHGTPAVLKLCKERNREAEALESLNPQGVVKLLRSDREKCALLLQHALPGITLKALQREDEQVATTIAAQLMTRLSGKSADISQFPSAPEIAAGHLSLSPGVRTLAPFRRRALHLLEKLASGPQFGEVVLHGDLHHDNIVFDQIQGWLAIDPKGLRGEPAYEAARLLCNPLGGFRHNPMTLKLMEKRLHIIGSVTSYPPFRVIAWGFIDCVVLACWSETTGGEMTAHTLRCAELLGTLLNSV